MGYIIALVLLVLLVPLLFVVFTHRSHAAEGRAYPDRGLTPSEPSSDQPTPRADATNQVSAETGQRLPPG